MSKEVDEKVVEMRFENAQFQKGVMESLKSIEKFTSALKMEGIADGIKNVNNSIKNISIAGLNEGIEQLNSRFSATGIMMQETIRRITDSILNLGEKFASALTTDAARDGLQEYELQLNSTQTIFNNVSKDGKTLEDVNNALNELNEYADKTIYNFGQMTDSIGKFSAAGVELDQSVMSIKGISNLAAYMGASANDNARAMYNLSQAVAAGRLQLMDWNSVVNANMGGTFFQEKLQQVAIELGTLDGKVSNFRDSLSDGWITADVLNETLLRFTEEGAKQYTDQALKAGKITQEEADEWLELASAMTKSATQVKTFTQLIDTVKEAIGTGWSDSFKLLIGDLDQAKELWTKINDAISPAIDSMTDARNHILRYWASVGGREKMLKMIDNIVEGLSKRIYVLKQYFVKFFPEVKRGGHIFVSFTDALGKMSENFANFDRTNDKTRVGMKLLYRGIQLASVAFRAAKTAIVAVIAVIREFYIDLESSDAITDFTTIVRRMSYLVSNVVKAFTSNEKRMSNIKDIIHGIASAFRILMIITGKVLKVVKDFVKNTIGDSEPYFTNFLASIGRWISGLEVAVRNGKAFPYLLESFADGFKLAVGGAIKFVKSVPELVEKIKGLKGVITGFNKSTGSEKGDGILNNFLAQFTRFKNSLGKIGPKISEFGKKIQNGISSAFSSISDFFSEHDVLSRVTESILKVLESFVESFSAVGHSISVVLTSISDAVSRNVTSISELVSSFIDTFKELVDGIKTTISGIGDTIKSVFFALSNEIIPTISNVFGAIGYQITTIILNIKPETFDKIGIIMMNIFSHLSKILHDILSSFDGFIKQVDLGLLGELFNTIISFVIEVLNQVKEDPEKALKEGLLAYIIKIIDDVSSAARSFGSCFEDIGEAVNNVAKSMKNLSKSLKTISNTYGIWTAGTVIKAFAMFLIAFAATIAIIAFTIKGAGIKNTSIAIGAVIGSIITMIVAYKMIMKATGDIDSSTLKGINKILTTLAATILVAAISITMVAKMGNPADVVTATISLGAMLIAIAGIVQYMYKELGPEFDEKRMKAIIDSMKTMGGVFTAVGLTIAKLAKNASKYGDDAMVQAMIAFGLIVVALAGTMKLMDTMTVDPKVIDSITKSMMSFAGVVVVLAIVIDTLAKIPQDQMVVAAEGMATILIFMGAYMLFVALMSKYGGDNIAATMLEISSGMVVMSSAIYIMTASMEKLSKIKNVGKTIGLLAASLAALILPGIIIAKMGLTKKFTLIANACLKIGAGFALLGAGTAMVGLGIMEVVTALILLADNWEALETLLDQGIELLISKIPAFMEAVFDAIIGVIDALIAYLPTAIGKLLSLVPELVGRLIDTVIDSLETLFDSLDRLGDILNRLIMWILTFVSEHIYDYTLMATEILVDFITGVIDGLSEKMDQILDSVTVFIISLLNGLAETLNNNGDDLLQAIDDLMTAVINFAIKALVRAGTMFQKIGYRMWNFISGGLVDKAKTTIARKVKILYNKFKEKFDEMVDDFKTFGKNLIDGLVKGIENKTEKALESIKEFGGCIKETFCDLFGIASPSKVMKKYGGYIAEGLGIGISKESGYAIASATKMGSKVLEKFDGMYNSINGMDFTNDLDFEPTITPVVDTSEFDSGMNEIDSSFGERSVDISKNVSVGMEDNAQFNNETLKAIKTLNVAINKFNATMASVPKNSKFDIKMQLDSKTIAEETTPFVDLIQGKSVVQRSRSYANK